MASRGTGWAIAKGLAAAGAKVVVAAQPSLEKVMSITEQDRPSQAGRRPTAEPDGAPQRQASTPAREPKRLKASFDAGVFRRVLGHYPTGVCVMTALEPDGRPVGMAVGSFTAVSLDPPLVGFMPDKSSTSWPRIARVGRFCVNVLSSNQQDLCRRFSAKADNKFEGLDFDLSKSGSPVLSGVVAWIDCRVFTVHEAGDHFIVLGEVLDLVAQDDQPLLFLRGRYGGFAPFVDAIA
jgi:flavin reductase (DIM6/NTAB) family NADH-FMN oxidoreductase RutF